MSNALRVRSTFVLSLVLILLAAGMALAVPKHGRPFLTPREEVERLRGIVQLDAWAAGEYAKLREAAGKGDGYASGLLYAMEGKAADAEAAKGWLLKWAERTGPQFAKWIETFKAEHRGPHMYYELDVQPALTYDRIYDTLDEESRAKIRQALENTCEYRLLYTNELGGSTPNLEFKPHWFVAVVGMALGNDRYIDWGLRSDGGQFGPNRGGVLTVLAHLLEDGGVWDEATIYPIPHMVLPLSMQMCRYLKYYDGTDLFNDGITRVAYRYGQMYDWPVGEETAGKPVPRKATGRLFIDSFVNLAYPLEPTGKAGGQLRVATYGDGATTYPAAWNDLFLCNPAGDSPRIWNAVDALDYAWVISGDPKYAGLLQFAVNYTPQLEWYRPFPKVLAPPPAPSTVQPEFGLAMLRADEGSSYWTGKGLAVMHLMTSPYGHQHNDKLGITLHGFGRLLYPDYLPMQYQAASAGYTRQTPAHNTLSVDGQNIDFGPCEHRHDFTPEVKYHVTSGGGYPGVKLTRALFLTRDYLLDLFAADSSEPHDYDYLIHALGNWKLERPSQYRRLDGTLDRYWWFENVMNRQTDAAWSLDFEQKTCQLPAPVGNFTEEWLKGQVGVRLNMAAAPRTQVYVGDSPSGGPVDDPVFNPEGNLPILVARRHARQALFVVAHEPYQNGQPQVKEVKLLASRTDAAFAMVNSETYTDWAFTVLSEPLKQPVDMASADGRQSCSGTPYGWMRLQGDKLTARGNWRGFRIVVPPKTVVKSFILNGKKQDFRQDGVTVAYGKAPEPAPDLSVSFPDGQRNLIAGQFNTVTVRVENHTGCALKEVNLVMSLPDGYPQESILLRFAELKPGEESTAALELDIPGGAADSLTLRPTAIAGGTKVPVICEQRAWDIFPPLAVRPVGAQVRLSEKGRTTAQFIAENNTDAPLAAKLVFILPAGVKTELENPGIDTVPPHGSREFSVTFVSTAEPGWYAANCLAWIDGRNKPDTGTAATFPLTVGTVLKPDYSFQDSAENLIVAPNYTLRTQMRNGASRYLLDGEGRLRYRGDFWNRRHGQEGPGYSTPTTGIINIYGKDGKLLRGWQESAGVLPFPTPAGQDVSVANIASLLEFYQEDRITWRFYRTWSSNDGLTFETGDEWVQLGGPAKIATVLLRGADGKLAPGALPQKKGEALDNVAGVEIAFPGYATNIAFAFPQPARVQFDGLRLRFDRTPDQTFEMGLIKPDTLEAWLNAERTKIKMIDVP